MIVVGLCATLGADRRRSFHRNVVAPGTADIFRKTLGSWHACSSADGGHTGDRFYCNGGYPGILPPPVLLPQNRCNFGEVDIVGPRADSDPCIWVIQGGVFGRFGVEVVGFPRFVRQSYAGSACYIRTAPPCGISSGISGSESACYSPRRSARYFRQMVHCTACRK